MNSLLQRLAGLLSLKATVKKTKGQKRIFSTALFSLFFSLQVSAAIDALNFASPAQEADYHRLTQELRCPQCQNNNIADSNAAIAVDMRARVFELLQQGRSRQEVVDYMVQRYGNFVTYNPPLTAATLILWLAPALLLLCGLIFILRRKSSGGVKTADFAHSRTLEQSDASKEDTRDEGQLSEGERQRFERLLKEKE
ncbi:cytochrome c-type biogenesis protein CcmH [Mesocricetibacter intestinalis]|uniref:Cytochrome c-type biogenesis protein n=1 Tax=Mesocricetibacter intestinalis TaxID=1521930 RepID=A0A4R6VBR2_9PAST|nr:cytochrome c-type biogenesis protein [Mesocricetibacter intestinalis]TDQ59657.1 cytochrome c-type biogenesis protein CcmH [Mesocricetibacter intestinalis]